MSEPPVTIEFGGWIFRRSPNAKSRSARVYYTAYQPAPPGKRAKGVGQLHVEVWKAAHPGEEIPPGSIIHHEDENPFNNDPSNLVCITRKEHAAHHREQYERPELREHLKKIQSKSTEWHRSPEGRAWHLT